MCMFLNLYTTRHFSLIKLCGHKMFKNSPFTKKMLFLKIKFQTIIFNNIITQYNQVTEGGYFHVILHITEKSK